MSHRLVLVQLVSYSSRIIFTLPWAFRLYNGQWHTAQLELSNLLEIERPKQPEKPMKVCYYLYL